MDLFHSRMTANELSNLLFDLLVEQGAEHYDAWTVAELAERKGRAYCVAMLEDLGFEPAVL